jgi:hypothetical protein
MVGVTIQVIDQRRETAKLLRDSPKWKRATPWRMARAIVAGRRPRDWKGGTTRVMGMVELYRDARVREAWATLLFAHT